MKIHVWFPACPAGRPLTLENNLQRKYIILISKKISPALEEILFNEQKYYCSNVIVPAVVEVEEPVEVPSKMIIISLPFSSSILIE
jgi:hypothetical protein